MDVNLNRLTESLKFIEDYIRFEIDVPVILEKIRSLRKDFYMVKKSLPISDLITHRRSEIDPGRYVKFDSIPRKDSFDLILANFTRAKESARIIEEILRYKNQVLSADMKKIRFKVYDIEKIVLERVKKKFDPKLYAIIDEKYLDKMPLNEMIKILQENNATMIQLRIKNLPDRKFYHYGERIKKLITKSIVKFIINNRVDIALGINADGVHLGQSDMPLKNAREILGDRFIIGISTHSLEEAISAQKNGADYIGVGAVFPTQTKPDAKVCSLNLIRTLKKRIKIPIIGIGGINDKNYNKVIKAGADGVALASFLFEGNLKKNLRAIKIE